MFLNRIWKNCLFNKKYFNKIKKYYNKYLFYCNILEIVFKSLKNKNGTF